MHSVQIGTFGNEIGEKFASKVASVEQVTTEGQEQQVVAIKVPKCQILVTHQVFFKESILEFEFRAGR